MGWGSSSNSKTRRGGGRKIGGGGSGSRFGNASAVSSPEKVAAPPNQTEFSETVTHTHYEEGEDDDFEGNPRLPLPAITYPTYS